MTASRYFRREDGTWLDVVMTTTDKFSTDGRIQADQLGPRLKVVEVQDGPDPRDVIVPITPSPPPPPSPNAALLTDLAAATTVAQLKAALIKRFS